MPAKIVAVLQDMIFMVRISDAAKRAGVIVEFVKTLEETRQRATGAAAVILDLDYAPPALIVGMKSAAETRQIPLIGYVSHVATEVIKRAKESGCDTVMARSAFVQKLEAMMREFAASQS